MLQGFPTPSKYKVLVRCNTFNQSKYIEDTLKGICMQQTNFPFLAFVIDDASTDGEQDILKKWIYDHCNSREVKTYDNKLAIILMAKDKDNENCIYAFHLLKKNLYMKPEKQEIHSIWREQCEYEALCEGDDYWIDPLKLQKQAILLDSNDDCCLVYGGCKTYSASAGRFRLSRDLLYSFDRKHHKTDGESQFYAILNKKIEIQLLTVMYRISAYNKIVPNSKFFLMGDLPLFFDLSQIGAFEYIDSYLGVYVKNQGSATRNPETRVRFTLSTQEMFVYYCNKYHYKLPLSLKIRYNKAYYDCYYHNITTKALYKPFTDSTLIKMVNKWNYIIFKYKKVPLYKVDKLICSIYDKVNMFILFIRNVLLESIS